MVSALAWLDVSREEQRRVREMLRLFAQTDSRDEMGVGRIRDVFSELLFPGTSVLLTRARYALFVPWCDLVGGRSGSETAERRLVATLKAAGADEGLIGSRIGPAVQTLPSAIYRTALIRWGILDEAADDTVATRNEDGELTERAVSRWHRELPLAPDGFPHHVPGGFQLTGDEAGWLRERILRTTDGSMLAHLLRHPHRPDPAGGAPWENAVCADANGELATILRHARLFSTVMHGASLLYNLLLGRRYRAAGLTRIEAPVDHYTGRLRDWSGNLAGDGEFGSWDLDEFWDLVYRHNPRIGPLTKDFVMKWIGVVHDRKNLEDDEVVHELVRHREQSLKKKQSRFTNDDLLARWNGASGAARMTYRWTQIHRLVTDVRDGLEYAGAAT